MKVKSGSGIVEWKLFYKHLSHTRKIYYFLIHLQLNGLSFFQVMAEQSIDNKCKATPPPLPPPRSPKEQADDKPETLVTISQPLRYFTITSWYNWSCVLSLLFNQDTKSLLERWKTVKRESENQFEMWYVWCSFLCLVTYRVVALQPGRICAKTSNLKDTVKQSKLLHFIFL